MRDVLRPLGLKPSPTIMGGFSEQSRHSADFGCVGICSLRMVRVKSKVLSQKTPIAGVFSMMNYSVTSGRVTVVFPKPSKVRVTAPAKERPSASFSVRAEKT